MKRSTFWSLTAAAALASLAFFPGTALAAQEQRCSELGSVCLCSEPLNDSTGTSGSGGTPWRLDPADSEGPNSKECAGDTGTGGAIEADGTGQFVPFPFATPPDSSIRHAFEWRSAGSGGTQQDLQGSPFSAWTNGTFCHRAYMSYSNNYDMNQDANHKGQEIDIGGGFQAFNASLHSRQSNPAFYNQINGLPEPNGFDHSIRFQDCRGQWCRFEQCIDRNASTGVTTFRGRITVVTGPQKGKDSITPTLSTTALSQIDTNARFRWIINGWRDGSPGGGAQPGSRYGSHALQAFWPQANTNQWIGPAYELEDGDFTPDPTGGGGDTAGGGNEGTGGTGGTGGGLGAPGRPFLVN